MSKDKIADYDGTTAGNNTDIGGISIAEGMLPSAVNNSMRELTKQLGAFANGTDAIDALDVTGAATVGGAFTSPGIDDNADATAITIDSSEKVGIGDTSPLGNKVHIRTAGSATSVNGDAGLVLESDDSTRCDLQFMGPDGAFQSIYFGDVSDDNRGIIAYSHSGNNMRFTVDASERMRLTSDGLTFNGDTAAANALNDYEEGTFTAVLDNVSVGYGTRAGRYTKIGNTVFVHLEIATTSLDGTDGSAYQIGGLPFAADGGGVLFTYDSENSTSLTQKSTLLGARMNNGLASVRLSRDGSDYQYNTGTQSAGSIVCTLQYFTTQ